MKHMSLNWRRWPKKDMTRLIQGNLSCLRCLDRVLLARQVFMSGQYFVCKSSVLCNTLPPCSSHCHIIFIFESECQQDLCGHAFSIFSPLLFKETPASRWQTEWKREWLKLGNLSWTETGVWVEGEEYEVTFFSIWIFKYHSDWAISLLALINANKTKWNYRGADKSLAWPGRKQATATKF